MSKVNAHRSGYKHTPLGWIPEEWEIRSFQDCFAIGNGQVDPKLEIHQDKILIAPNHIESNTGRLLFTETTKKQQSISGKYLIFQGDIIYSKIRPYLRKAILAPFDCLCSADMYPLRGTQVMNTHFGLYVIFSDRFTQLVSNHSGRTGIPKVNREELNSITIPVPTLTEQFKIAEILSKWDDTITKTQQLITQLQHRNRGLTQQLLTGKKRLKGFETTKWHLKSLEEVGVFRNGKAHENLIDVNGEYAVVNSKFISTGGKTFKKSSVSLSALFAGEIVMVMSDIPKGKALAKCFFIDANNKYTLNQRICSITSKENTNSKFLFYLLNRNYHYLSFDNGVSQTNLKKEEVLECPLLMPEKDEQDKIAQTLDACISEVQLFEQKLAALHEQKKGLMQKLLTGEVRVNTK